MTEIKVFKKNGSVVRVACDGHTGYGVEGEDIVCAALSSIVQTALLGLLAVARINVSFVKDDGKGRLEFTLPELDERRRHDADVILDTMLCGVSDLREAYSDFIDLEVD